MERYIYDICQQWEDGYCSTADDGCAVEKAIKNAASAVLRVHGVHLNCHDDMSVFLLNLRIVINDTSVT